MDEWLFWEQYSHEPYVAVCRFQMVYLGKAASELDPEKVKRGYAALDHLEQHYTLYGAWSGVRTARKHIGWYVRGLPGGEAFRGAMNAIEDCDAQMGAVAAFFDALAQRMDRIPAVSSASPEPQDEDALA